MTTANPRMKEWYTLPTSSNGAYTKLVKNGDTKLRILTPFITWWEYFDTENKPHRQIEKFKECPWIWEKRTQKEFRAMCVWNYDTKRVEIWEVTQAKIKEALFNLNKDPDFWNPMNYDIKVNRTWEQLDTTYQVKTLSKSEFKPEDMWEYGSVKEITLRAMSINLDALLSWGDPFMPRENDSKLPF